LIHEQEERQDIEYLKIVYDDINQLIALLESYQDTVNSTRELYIANVSLLMNDTVRTLTVFSAILLPLTFITSVFGMNGLDLNNIWNVPFGFVVVAAVMAAAAVGLIVFLKTKQWILVRGYSGSNNKERKKQDKEMQH
jgi:magnesium transporter